MPLRALCVGIGWAMLAGIVAVSLIPSPPEVDFEGSDKAGHFLSYALLMFWFAQLYARRAGYAAGFVILGVGLEFLQGWTGYRSFDGYDMLANTAGVLLGWGGAALLGRRLIP